MHHSEDTPGVHHSEDMPGMHQSKDTLSERHIEGTRLVCTTVRTHPVSAMLKHRLRETLTLKSRAEPPQNSPLAQGPGSLAICSQRQKCNSDEGAELGASLLSPKITPKSSDIIITQQLRHLFFLLRNSLVRARKEFYKLLQF